MFIYTETSNCKGSYAGQGAQIDLLLDRAHRVINIFVVKFVKGVFTIPES